MTERREVHPEILDSLGMAEDSFSLSENPEKARILKVVAPCEYCGLPRLAFWDKKTGDYIAAKCPRVGEPGRDRCFWGGYQNLPIGED
jgi:hypothetical protein